MRGGLTFCCTGSRLDKGGGEVEKCEQTWRKSFKSLGHCVKLESRVGREGKGASRKGCFQWRWDLESKRLTFWQFPCGQLPWGQ